jgi:hypothetical protein
VLVTYFPPFKPPQKTGAFLLPPLPKITSNSMLPLPVPKIIDCGSVRLPTVCFLPPNH